MNSNTRGHWLASTVARSAGVAPERKLDLMIIVDNDCRQPPAAMQDARLAGALVTCPMEGVTGMIAGLDHVP